MQNIMFFFFYATVVVSQNHWNKDFALVEQGQESQLEPNCFIF